MHRSNLQILISLTLLLVPVALSALPDDRRQLIIAKADKFTTSPLKNGGEKREYSGSVTISQGSLKTTGDTITLYVNKNGETTKLVTKGNPATFQHQAKFEQSPVTAKADTIQYVWKNDSIKLMQNASINQQGSIINGDTISYNLTEESVSAKGGDEPVTMVLQPVDYREPSEKPAGSITNQGTAAQQAPKETITE